MANLKNLIVNGVSRFIGKVYINDSEITIINGSTVGNNPKFTDTTYNNATQLVSGLMSTTDKTFIEEIKIQPIVRISSTQPTGGKTGDIWMVLVDE